MKKIPKFENELEESQFWDENDSAEFVDWSKSENVSFSNLKPTTKSISLRLPEYMIARLKQEANKLDVPYQSFVKVLINEALERRQTTNIS